MLTRLYFLASSRAVPLIRVDSKQMSALGLSLEACFVQSSMALMSG